MKSVKSPSGDQGIPGWNTEHEKKKKSLFKNVLNNLTGKGMGDC